MSSTAKQELKRAYLMIEWGRLEDALEACDRAASLTSHHLPHALAGSFLSAFGHHTEALRRLRRALRIAPNDPFSNLAFAETCLMLGRTRQARSALGRIETLSGQASEWADSIEALSRELCDSAGMVVPR